jgi:glutaminase
MALLEGLVESHRECCGEGRVAVYIPELAKADPARLGIAVALPDGSVFSAGDGEEPFTFQSVSKVISLAAALETLGEDSVFARVGRDPTADPFNSIMRLEMVKPHRPQNPLINAGALVVLSLLPQPDGFSRYAFVRDWARKLTGNPNLSAHEPTYLSEKGTSDRNRALAYFMRSVGVFEGDVEDILDSYFHQCALQGTARDLAVMGATLAGEGVDPLSGRRVLSVRHARVIRALMATCGLYDGSGDFAVRAGVPAKSGVGGGISAAVPGRLGIGVYGPALDERGNSIGGIRLIEDLVEAAGLRVL